MDICKRRNLDRLSNINRLSDAELLQKALEWTRRHHYKIISLSQNNLNKIDC